MTILKPKNKHKIVSKRSIIAKLMRKIIKITKNIIMIDKRKIPKLMMILLMIINSNL